MLKNQLCIFLFANFNLSLSLNVLVKQRKTYHIVIAEQKQFEILDESWVPHHLITSFLALQLRKLNLILEYNHTIFDNRVCFMVPLEFHQHHSAVISISKTEK